MPKIHSPGIQQIDSDLEYVRSLEHLNNYFLQAPVAIAVITSGNYRFAVANDMYLQTIGRSREEIVNRPAFEVMPELKDQLKHILDKVIDTGVGFRAYEYKIENIVDGKLQTDYYNFVYEPVKDSQGITTGVFVSGYNITEQVHAKIQLLGSEQQMRTVANAMPILISYLDKDERYQFNNKWYEDWFGESSDRVKGRSLQELLGEEAYKTIQPYVRRALAGERVSFESKINYRKHGETYIHATYIPDISSKNEVRGFYALVEDITERRLAHDKVKQSEFHFRRLADTVPASIWITNKDGYCTYLNKHWYELTGQSEQEALGFGWLTATHPDDVQAAKEAFIKANSDQVEFNSTYRLKHADGQYRWVVDRARPRYDDAGNYEGLTGSVIDIHQEKQGEERIRISEAKYRNLFNTMEQGFCIIEVIFDEKKKPVDYRFVEVNPVFGEHTGLQHALSKTARELLPNLEQHWFDMYANVALTGESIRFSEGSEVMGRWFDVYAFKVGEPGSSHVAILFSDVSDRKKSEQKLRRSEESFRALVTATSNVIYRMSPDWTAMQNLQGNGFLSDTGEPVKDWLLHYIHPAEHERVKKQINEAIQTKSVFELEHQVLRTDGTIGWTFSRAIPVLDPKGNIIEWFGAASDISERKFTAQALQESENRYRSLANQLEKLVAERTMELQRSNEELQQFAHVASHDLREPVRKVKTFIDRLILHYSKELPERAIEYLKKIDRSCDRMNTMVEGVLQYSSLNAMDAVYEQVDLRNIIETIETDLEVVIAKNNAVVNKEKLPTVTGSPFLLYQLFYNLINNSLKFSSKDRDPVITVTCSNPTIEEVSQADMDGHARYVKLSVKDNGIGFHNEDAQLIFGTFTRLHAKDQYEGTGLGLTLCKTIVIKHGGAMWAEGELDKGATFNILLPA
jgi:hypothetical protein